MSENTVMNVISPSTLEELRCCICTGYLSCSPVGVLPDGRCICGHCAPSSSDISIFRVLPLEAVLSKTSFPCQFKEYGCTEMVLFGQTGEHESKCRFRSFACPVLLEDCAWKGVATKLKDHFTENHSDLVKQNAEFKLTITENAQGIFMVVKDAVTFIIKYFYNANDSNLRYIVRYCAVYPNYDITLKIQLVNDLDADCNINLKAKKCLLYDDSFYGMQNACAVDLSKFLPGLDCPDAIIVVFNLLVQIHTPEVDLTLAAHAVVSLKCGKCYNSLIPPLFNLNENVVCYKCGKNQSKATPSNDAALLKRVNETEFSCRWRNCTSAGKCDIIKVHELLCPFRNYKCQFGGCKIYLKRVEVIEHYEKCHNSHYLSDAITYKFSFSKPYCMTHVFTITDNAIIVLVHKNVKTNDSIKHQLGFSSTDESDLTTFVHLEHQHCKIKSKLFNFIKEEFLIITLNQLPPCFRSDEELTVNVTIV